MDGNTTECKCKRRVLTYKISNGNKSFWFQCLDCGRSKNAVAKKKLFQKDMDNAKPFDVNLKRQKFEEEIEAARRKREAEWQAKQAERKIAYDEYMQSDEWYLKRELVLKTKVYPLRDTTPTWNSK